MKTNDINVIKHTATIRELIENENSPLPIDVMPNRMGINLVAVESVEWEKREDGQLVNLKINFIPDDNYNSNE